MGLTDKLRDQATFCEGSSLYATAMLLREAADGIEELEWQLHPRPNCQVGSWFPLLTVEVRISDGKILWRIRQPDIKEMGHEETPTSDRGA